MSCTRATPRILILAVLVLAAGARLAHGQGTIATDKENYQSGETVFITGAGWAPGETVSLTILADSVLALRANLEAVADAAGHVANSEFVIQPTDANTAFLLQAEGRTSGMRAEAVFLDGFYVRWVTVSPQSPSPVNAGSAATYTVTVGGYRFWGWCYAQDTNLTVDTALPAGATWSFTPPVVHPGGAGCSATSTLTISTSGSTPAGASSFSVTARYTATDAAAATAYLTVVATDVTPPVPDVDPLPVIAGDCSATITTFPTATDDVSGAIVGTTSDPLTYPDQGTYVVHWTYTDAAGNASHQEQQVIVQDTTPPGFASAPPDVTVTAEAGACAAVVAYSYPPVADNCSGHISFTPAVNYPVIGTSTCPGSTMAGDLDGDGDDDVVVSNYNAPYMSVLLNHGDGTFAPAVNVPTGYNVNRGRIADLDQDGDLDLVFAGARTHDDRMYMRVLFNHGDATFSAPVSYEFASPNDVPVADFDGDGDPDVVVPEYYTDDFVVMLNQGDGSFVRGGTFACGSVGYAVTADFDQDGDTDLALGSVFAYTISLFFNNGDATFGGRVTYPTASVYVNLPHSVGDLDGDGDVDLYFGNGSAGSFSVMLNNGDGTFGARVDYPTTPVPGLGVLVDLDGDGDLDLALEGNSTDEVLIHLNNGDGTFTTPAVTFPVHDQPHGMCSADLDRDGDKDLAVANYVSNDISVLLNTGSGITIEATIPPGAPFPVGTTPVTLTARDAAGNPATVTFNAIVHAFPGWTCGGSNVPVNPVDPATGSAPVTLTFSEVTTPGQTSLAIEGTGPPPPFGFRLGAPPMYFELNTSAGYSGPVKVCIDYSAISFATEERLRLWHIEGDQWVDRTVSVDSAADVICASVSSFSTFAIFEMAPPANIAGTVTSDCGGTPYLRGVTVDVYSDGDGALVGGDITDDGGHFAIENLDPGHYSVVVVTPLGYVTATDEVAVALDGADRTVDFALSCVAITAKPRSIGFWKHQLGVATGGAGEGQMDAAKLCGYLDLIEDHFYASGVNPVTVYTPPASGVCADKLHVANELVNLAGNAGMTARAKQQLMALLMNVAALRLHLTGVISEDGATVSQAITVCDVLIDNPAGDHEKAKAIADMINNAILVPDGMIPLDTGVIPYSSPRQTSELPDSYALSQNVPNPFNPVTEISFDLPEPARVELVVYDVSGRTVIRLVDRSYPAGRHAVTWNGRNGGGASVATGVYFYRLQAGSFAATKRMVLLK